MTRRGAAVVACVAAAVTGLTACGAGDSEQEGNDVMRERTIAAFEESDPSLATFAGEEGTRPEPIETPFVDDWFVFQLTGQHRVTVVAVTKEGDPRGVDLSDAPKKWDEVVEGVSVTDAATAEEVADAWVRATRPTTGAARIIDSVDDIDLTGAKADEVREELREKVGDDMDSTAATASGSDWTTTRWMVHDNDLVRLDLTVHSDGTVGGDRQTVREDLPGPIPL